MHTALLALDVIMLNFTDRIQAVEMLTLNTSSAVNWIESVHRTAMYTIADTLLVPLSIDVVEHSIAQIIDLSNANILITVNTVHTQQMIGTMADGFEVSTLQITETPFLLASFPSSHGTQIYTAPAQLQCSRYRAWEPGNKATFLLLRFLFPP